MDSWHFVDRNSVLQGQCERFPRCHCYRHATNQRRDLSSWREKSYKLEKYAKRLENEETGWNTARGEIGLKLIYGVLWVKGRERNRVEKCQEKASIFRWKSRKARGADKCGKFVEVNRFKDLLKTHEYSGSFCKTAGLSKKFLSTAGLSKQFLPEY